MQELNGKDKAKLYRYCVEHDKDKNKAYYDAYFNREISNEEHRYVDVDGEILALCSSKEKILSLHGNLLKSTVIRGPIYTDKDFADALFQEELERSARTSLITFAYPRSDFQYEDYGFETVVEHYQYNIAVDSLPQLSVSGIVMDVNSEDLLKAYDSFTDYFTGYFKRSVEEFEELSKIYKGLGGGVIAYYENREIAGYAFYIRHQSFVEISECVYNTSGSLFRLLSFLSKGVSRIVLIASESERIHKILPDAKRNKFPFLLARINDKDLFERLYHIKIISAYSGFHAFGKPVFNRNLIT